MLLSIFTPTHDARFLVETWKSLEQAVRVYGGDWEWVLCPNPPAPGAAAPQIPAEIPDLPQIRRLPLGRAGIGHLKLQACLACRGDYLIELDHDDLLHPQALAAIAEAAADEPGFIFSDHVGFHEHTRQSQVFASRFGWEQYETDLGGQPYTAMRAFAPVTAATLSRIMWAPNHLRAWRRQTYETLGGHNTRLPLGDDYDLICRTYLSGATFRHVPRPLYYQRIWERNTHTEQRDVLRPIELETSRQYRFSMIQEWCRRAGLPLLSVGPPPGLAKQIKLSRKGPEALLNQPEGGAGAIVLSHVLHRVPNCSRHCQSLKHPAWCVVSVIDACYRALAPQGWLLTTTPSVEGAGGFMDPLAQSYWNEQKWWHFWHKDYARRCGSQARFQPTDVRTTQPTAWDLQNNMRYVVADLTAIKGPRHPGEIFI